MNWIKKNKILFAGLLIRLFSLIYGDFQDNFSKIKYTDIDYKVYTDAAKYILLGKSPYLRHTYRYTPILSYLMIPNILYFNSIGKYLFTISDLLCGVIIQAILKQISKNYNKSLIAFWVLNPLAINCSTRGSADTLISFFLLLTLYCLLNKKIFLASLFFGFIVHFKIYPIIYSLPIYFFIDHNEKSKKFCYIFTKNRILFTFVSATFFFILLAYFYNLYGWQFLYETYFYHFIRKDNRHNFSVYFYYIYLNFENVSVIKSILTFVPQFVLLIISGIKFYKDLPFCIFIQTFIFVTFNKVVTAQYFIWFIPMIPIIFENNLLFTEKKK